MGISGRIAYGLLIGSLSLATAVTAQGDGGSAKPPASTDSVVAEDLFQLTDAVGPRTVGSPALQTARNWLQARLKEYGIKSIRLEENPSLEIMPGVPWTPPGWSYSELSIQQQSPWPATLIGIPVLFSTATNGVQTGEAMMLPLPPPDPTAIEAFKQQYRGKLKGKFLLMRDSERRRRITDLKPPYHRYSEEELRRFESLPPGSEGAPTPSSPAPPQPSASPQQPSLKQMMDQFSALNHFLKSEGVLGLIDVAAGEGGTLFVRPPSTPPGIVESPPPTFDLAAEHFNRIIRLLKHGIPVRLEVNLQSQFHGGGTRNLLADIPGTEKPDEIVIVGAHLDSWHVATGSTDNAANVAILLETARLLAKSTPPPKRTIRFAFWDGEELGMLGSRGYVETHLIDSKSGQRKPEYAKTTCYFNLDYGAGRIRGVYLQGRTELQPMFSAWLRKIPGEALVASPRTALGSDQRSFDSVGIPGISFIQDPLDYDALTHHTNMDVSDYVPTENLNYNVEVLAKLLMEVANAEQPFPTTFK